MDRETLIEAAVDSIIVDIEDRRGLKNVWQDIDADTQSDIRSEWSSIIQRKLAPLLQWKSVADVADLPKDDGTYIVRYANFQSPSLAEYVVGVGFLSVGPKVAYYIPVPIPEYVKEQR